MIKHIQYILIYFFYISLFYYSPIKTSNDFIIFPIKKFYSLFLHNTYKSLNLITTYNSYYKKIEPYNTISNTIKPLLILIKNYNTNNIESNKKIPNIIYNRLNKKIEESIKYYKENQYVNSHHYKKFIPAIIKTFYQSTNKQSNQNTDITLERKKSQNYFSSFFNNDNFIPQINFQKFINPMIYKFHNEYKQEIIRFIYEIGKYNIFKYIFFN